MRKKITALCSVVIALSICFTVFGTACTGDSDVVTATMKIYSAPKEETTTNSALGDIVGEIGSGSSGDLGDLLGGVDTGGLGDTLGGFGDALGGIGGALGGIADGMGDALGGLTGGTGDALGGILGGVGGNSGTEATTIGTTIPVQTTSADIGLIIPVPAATQTTATETIPSTTASGETVDYAATSNPYTKPSATFSAVLDFKRRYCLYSISA